MMSRLSKHVLLSAVAVTLIALSVNAAPVPKAPLQLAIDGNPPASAMTALLFDDGFENGEPSGLYKPLNNGAASRSYVTSPVREGKLARKCQLTWNSLKDYRCDSNFKVLNYDSFNSSNLGKFFQDYWYGFSVYIPKQDLANFIVFAWHGYGTFNNKFDENDTEMNPPMAIETSFATGKFRLRCNSNAKNPTLDEETVKCFNTQDIADLSYDEWHDFVVRVRWDYRDTPDGLVQVWHCASAGKGSCTNPQLVLDKQKVRTGYNDRGPPYIKGGMYCSGDCKFQTKQTPSPGTVKVVYHDAIRVAGPEGSYEAVAPR